MSELLAVAKRKKPMANIYEINGKLYLNYRLNGKRIRKATGLLDTKENRKRLLKDVIPALEYKIKMGDYIKPDDKKFSYYFQKFLMQHEQDKSYHIRIYVYKKVNSVFGNYNVSSIKRQNIKEYLNSINGKNATKREYLKCLKGVLEIALDDEVVKKNVAENITFKKEAKSPVEVFNSKEVELLISNAEGMLKNFLAISFYTGMRSGEVLGLMHQDILEDRICVRRSISRGRVTTPKTIGSIRDIPMFDKVRPYITAQKKMSKSLYLFDYNGSFIKDVTNFKLKWKRLIKTCEIDYRKIYATRHSFITAMLDSGKFKIMEIAAIVGHTSPQMIMTNYTGFIKDEHLKIDTNFELFDTKNGQNLVKMR